MDNFEPIENHNSFSGQNDFSFNNFEPQQGFEPIEHNNFEPQENFDGNFEPHQDFQPQQSFNDSFEPQTNFEPQQDFEPIGNKDFGNKKTKDNFEPLNNDNFSDFKTKTATKAKPQNKQEEDKSEDDDEEQGNGKVVKIAFVIMVIVLCGFFFLLFSGKKGDADYTDVVVERQAPTNRVPDLKIVPNKSVFKAGEKFKFDISRDVFFDGNLSDVILSFKIPENIPYRQKIEDLIIVPTPSKIEKEPDGTYAYITLRNPKGTIQVHMAGHARVGTYTAEKATKYNKNIDGQLSAEDKEIYTSSEKNIESNDSYIKTISSKYVPKATNELDTVKNIFDYVVATIKYNENDIGKDKGAVWALRSKSGVCMEFADTMVALCRSKGIPARVAYGFDIPFIDMARLSNNGHAWVEVYFPEYGWVTFDPTNKISNSVIKQANALRITPYELLSYAFQNRLYLIVDTNEIHMHYKGQGNVESKNLHIKLTKR